MKRPKGLFNLDWMLGATEPRKIIKTICNIFWIGEELTFADKNCFWRFRLSFFLKKLSIWFPFMYFQPFKCQSHKIVKRTQIICQQFPDKLFECVWSFCGVGTETVNITNVRVKIIAIIAFLHCFINVDRLAKWLMFVYEVSVCGLECSCSYLNFSFPACFEQGVPWHSGNCRV